MLNTSSRRQGGVVTVKSRLSSLEELHDAGLVSDEEYTQKRADILARLKAKAEPDNTTFKRRGIISEKENSGLIALHINVFLAFCLFY